MRKTFLNVLNINLKSLITLTTNFTGCQYALTELIVRTKIHFLYIFIGSKCIQNNKSQSSRVSLLPALIYLLYDM